MDAYEATRIVFSRIQGLDPENASKIMGLLLIQDHGEKEMIRLAFGPETLLHSLVIKARSDLGLSPTTPSTPSSPSPFFSSNNNNSTNPISLSRQNSSSSFPLPPSRMHNNTNNNNNNHNNNNNNHNLTSPSSLSINSSSWAPSTYSHDHLQHPDDLVSPNSNSYASINGFSGLGSSSSDLIDEFQLQDQLSFLNDGPKNSDLFYPPQQPPPELDTISPNNSSTDGMLYPSYAANWGAMSNGNHHHRRSSSVTDMINLGGLSSDPLGAGLGWKPCLYYARGYCKNGTTCRFLHDSTADPNTMIVGSPNKLDAMEQCQELLLRSSKTHQQQQQQQQQQLSTASQLMASAAAFPYTASSAAAAGKCMNFLLQQQQNDTQRAAAAAAALMLGEDVHKFGRSRMERSDFPSPGSGGGGGIGGMVNPGSRQIYLTFPADSTFREEDVSNYFSIYGPVQDVRIPYQQKRMFGFVTFVYPETVKLILAKGNPHFVCDARVLVKPYKEKGKVPDKKQQQQQQLERGDFSACTTPTGLDSGDPYDLQLGARMYNNTQDVLLRRKLEEQQADLQQAIELQGRRLMGLQLLDVKKHHHHHRNLSAGAALNIPSPTQLHPPYMMNHPFMPPSSLSLSDRSSPEFPEEINCGSPATSIEHQQFQRQNLMNAGNNNKDEYFFGDHDSNGNGNGSGSDGKESPKLDDCNFHDSNLEHNLPDSPFASPIKSGGDPPSFFSSTSSTDSVAPAGSSSSSSSSSSLIASSAILPATSTLDMASLKSCFIQIPRFSSDHGAIGM